MGDYDRAIQNYDLALALAAIVPGDRQGEIYLDRGLSYLMQEEIEAAIADFTQAIAWQKNSDRAYYNRACAYSRGGGLREAIADFTQALAINPNLSEAYASRGFLRHQLGWERGALEDLAIASRHFQQQGN
ncbi:MAG: tetratricopeptide repeat protein, partial [Chloroflexaceae bacterium]|nr:tetratricopeptide repeat protein [Chloroflexaceae bacterium]